MIYIFTVAVVVGIFLIVFSFRRSGIYLNRGYKLEKEGNLTEAMKEYESAIKLDSEDYDARYRLAKLSKDRGLPNKAIENFQFLIAARKFPENRTESEVRLELGECYETIASLSNAFVEYHKVLQTDPNNIDAHKRIASIYAGQELQEKAVKHYRRVLDIKPSDKETLFQLGLTYIDMNRPHDAMKEIEKAVKLSPGNIEATFYLGILYKDRNKPNQAVRLFQNVAERATDQNLKMEAHRLLGETYKEIGLIDEAITNYEVAAEVSGKANDIERRKEILYNLGMAYTKKGNKEMAIEKWERLRNIDDSYKDVNELIRTGKESFYMSDFDKALLNWDKAKSEESHILKGRGLMRARVKFNLEALEKQLGDFGIGGISTSSTGSVYERYIGSTMKQFIHITIKLLEKMGFKIIKDVHNPNDVDYLEGKGIDFIAESNIRGRQKDLYLIQVRRWNELVGEIPLRNCIEKMLSLNCSKALFIATSEFTNQSLAIVRRDERLSLIDSSGLSRALKKVMY